MSTISIPVQNVTNAIEINKMKIVLLNHILSQEVTLEITLESTSLNVSPIVKNLLIVGSEYENWGNDDNYLIQLAAQKLNIILSNVTY
jgi:hypothetical protein